mmetsp:Transcript_45816/g.51077  ORF Transcript_45816/g.51077 Transcript_45816/m.51077 type:complete len:213 (+) Transcript_45816:144-782(+)
MSKKVSFDSSTVSRSASTTPYTGTAASLPILGNFSSSMVESTPKRITPVVTTKVAKPWVSPLISWEKSNQGYVSNYVPYSTGSVTPSASSVIQRIVYQSILPSVPSLLPQPLSAQSRTASCQDTNTILPHPWQQIIASNGTKTISTSQLSTTEIISPPPATIPVTPLIDTTPSKTTTDYQNIFFPTMFEEEEFFYQIDDTPWLELYSMEDLD